MNFIKKSVILISTMCFMVSSISSTFFAFEEGANDSALSSSSYQQDLTSEQIETINAQGVCIDSYSEFLSQLTKNYTPMFSAKSSSADYVYPDDYAGVYFNEFNDNKMTLLLTDFENLQYYKNIFNSDICHYELADYAYNDVCSLYDELSYVLSDFNNVNYIAIDVINNRVKVEIVKENDNQDIIDYVSNLGYDANMLEFELTSKKNDVIIENGNTNLEDEEISRVSINSASGVSYNAYSGSKIYSPQKYVSVGYNAINKQTGEYGIVTAGHFFSNSNIDKIYNQDGVLINENRKGCIYYDNTITDVAFIPANSVNTLKPSVYIRNFANYNNNQSAISKQATSLSPAMVNTVVYSFGATTGKQEHTIVDMDRAFNVNGVTVKCICTKSSSQVKGGDSGGPLILYTNANKNIGSVIGITKGYDYNGVNSYFISSVSILQKLKNIEIY